MTVPATNTSPAMVSSLPPCHGNGGIDGLFQLLLAMHPCEVFMTMSSLILGIMVINSWLYSKYDEYLESHSSPCTRWNYCFSGKGNKQYMTIGTWDHIATLYFILDVIYREEYTSIELGSKICDRWAIRTSMPCIATSLATLLDSWPILLLQIHSIIPMMLIGTLWFLASGVRKSESMKQLSDCTTSTRRSIPKKKLPTVSIVLPTRGYHQYSADNWKAILGFKYGAWIIRRYCLQGVVANSPRCLQIM